MTTQHSTNGVSDDTSVVVRGIVCTPGVCGGKARIDGTRIRVQDVAIWHELQAKSPDEIVSTFPQLSMADVYAALSYFWAHREEIVSQIDRERLRYEERKRTQPSLVAEKLREIGQGNATDDSLSP